MKKLRNWDNKTWLSSKKYINSFNNFLKSKIKFKKNTQILDIGCGRANIISALQKKFPAIQGPHKEDICYATTNRQLAVKEIASKIDALLVVGAPNSSNSKRLVEVGKRAGCKYSQLVQRASEIDFRALEGIENLGITAGASAPEVLINEVIDSFREKHLVDVEIVETAVEHVNFKVPRVLREPA